MSMKLHADADDFLTQQYLHLPPEDVEKLCSQYPTLLAQTLRMDRDAVGRSRLLHVVQQLRRQSRVWRPSDTSFQELLDRTRRHVSLADKMVEDAHRVVILSDDCGYAPSGYGWRVTSKDILYDDGRPGQVDVVLRVEFEANSHATPIEELFVGQGASPLAAFREALFQALSYFGVAEPLRALNIVDFVAAKAGHRDGSADDVHAVVDVFATPNMQHWVAAATDVDVNQALIRAYLRALQFAGALTSQRQSNPYVLIDRRN